MEDLGSDYFFKKTGVPMDKLSSISHMKSYSESPLHGQTILCAVMASHDALSPWKICLGKYVDSKEDDRRGVIVISGELAGRYLTAENIFGWSDING